VTIEAANLVFRSKEPGMITVCMQNAEHNDSLAFGSVKQLVRKTARQYSPESAIVNRVTLRIMDPSLNRTFDLSEKLRTQSRSLTLVPL
jgi:hypothetical protein